MVNRNLMRQYDAPLEADEQIHTDFETAIAEWIGQADKDYEANKIVTGQVIIRAGSFQAMPYSSAGS